MYSCNPDIVLNKSVDNSNVIDGTLINFTITVESLGIDPVTNIVITDVLPDGLEFISASVPIGSFSYPNWSLGTLNQGELVTMTLTARARMNNIYLSSVTHTNTVSNSQDQVDNNITADNPSVNVQVNRIAPASVISNRRITVRVNKF